LTGPFQFAANVHVLVRFLPNFAHKPSLTFGIEAAIATMRGQNGRQGIQ
jgi:hypothetical protein